MIGRQQLRSCGRQESPGSRKQGAPRKRGRVTASISESLASRRLVEPQKLCRSRH